MDRHRIGIVIPALNEAATIGGVVEGASVYGQPIVVDDGSNDSTAEIAHMAGAAVVRHVHSRGYDAALNSGFVAAAEQGCEYIITMDGDGQHDPALVGRILDALDAGADLVVGIRQRRQRLAEHAFAWWSRRSWGIHDPLCGVKGYRAELYRKLGHFDSYGSIGTELALFGARSGCRITEVSVETRTRTGRSRFGSGLRAEARILRAMIGAIRRSGAAARHTPPRFG